ncbi:succinate dehydrogenase, cytochrome b556 subunit [Roseospirillum parvum]|uniref:Succinate dehydrogenase cytochrome b556 subunit n=1 Tax=Roseospirillum parvum TaxID=83401 RepID=A0A1G7WQ61_9PROT|nr:succinate dehydrogenase, cytochrome b556 subunit [Roseospirillum parvum]SDG74044.1 succinate dehydrogenase / fumarate reductase cytochrome b subunit [Roseospirillum parvum]
MSEPRFSPHLAPYDNQLRRGRPLSPHLQVYRFALTMFLSITHRVTGVGVVLGTVMVMVWLGTAAAGPETYAAAQGFFGSWVGVFLILAWSAATLYHLASGIRFLMWDIGKGFGVEGARRSGIVLAVVWAVLTAVVWAIGFAAW